MYQKDDVSPQADGFAENIVPSQAGGFTERENIASSQASDFAEGKITASPQAGEAGDSTEREITMLPLVGSFAENKEVARRLRIEQIMPALSRGELVVLDFDGVTGTTQSFVHALISDALREQPEVAFDNLYFKNASPDVRKIVEIVYRYMQESLDGGF